MYLIVTDLIVDLIVELIVCSRRHTARYFKLSSAESLAGSSLLCVPWAPFAPAHVRMHALLHQPPRLSHTILCVSPRCGASCRRSADQCARNPSWRQMYLKQRLLTIAASALATATAATAAAAATLAASAFALPSVSAALSPAAGPSPPPPPPSLPPPSPKVSPP